MALMGWGSLGVKKGEVGGERAKAVDSKQERKIEKREREKVRLV